MAFSIALLYIKMNAEILPLLVVYFLLIVGLKVFPDQHWRRWTDVDRRIGVLGSRGLSHGSAIWTRAEAFEITVERIYILL